MKADNYINKFLTNIQVSEYIQKYKEEKNEDYFKIIYNNYLGICNSLLNRFPLDIREDLIQEYCICLYDSILKYEERGLYNFKNYFFERYKEHIKTVIRTEYFNLIKYPQSVYRDKDNYFIREYNSVEDLEILVEHNFHDEEIYDVINNIMERYKDKYKNFKKKLIIFLEYNGIIYDKMTLIELCNKYNIPKSTIFNYIANIKDILSKDKEILEMLYYDSK